MLKSILTVVFILSELVCISIPQAKSELSNKAAPEADELVFYSNGSTFSPVIVLQAEAVVTWTWDDNTISNSPTPTKNYGSAALRKNSLKVTPWSAVRRINIGYDALDGGSASIELNADQNVSMVENLHLLAPYLKEWCSSYNLITSLDFSNFINIETIECFRSKTLKQVNLTNTPNLKRACFEENALLNLDLSHSPLLEDLRGALNYFKTFTLSNHTENIWHFCVRDNPQLINTYYNNLSIFPNIAELYIGNTNQRGSLIIPSTLKSKAAIIDAANNKYSSLDLRGSLKSIDSDAYVNCSFNELTSVDIMGCIQIKKLNLQNNRLESSAIDLILRQLDDFRSYNGIVNLTYNKPPSSIGNTYKQNLEKRGWFVFTDQDTSAENIDSLKDSIAFKVYPNNGMIQIEMNKIPRKGTVIEIRNLLGVKILEQKIYHLVTSIWIKKSNINTYIVTLKSKDKVSSQKITL